MTKEKEERLIKNHIREIRILFRMLREKHAAKKDNSNPIWYVYLTNENKIVAKQNIFYYNITGEIEMVRDAVCLGTLDVSKEWGHN